MTEPRYALAEHERLATAIAALRRIKDQTDGDDDLWRIHCVARDALAAIEAKEPPNAR